MAEPPADYSAAWAQYFASRGEAGAHDHKAAWDEYYRRQAAAAAAPVAAAPPAQSAWAAPAGAYGGAPPHTAASASYGGDAAYAAGGGYGAYPQQHSGGVATRRAAATTVPPSYHAVPPPPSLDVSQGRGGGARGPAYVSVPPRRAAAPAPAAPSAAPGSASWPPSLRSYVERAFAAFPASARPALAAALKATIAEAQAKGDVWTRAWDSLPLPDVSVGAPPPPPPQARMGQPPGHPTAWYQHAQPPPPPPPARRHPPSAAAQAAATAAYAGGTGVSGVVSRRAALEALLAEKGDVELDDAALDALAVRGTATILEKSYFRLTAPPDPATVRPEPVLAAALERLVGLMAGRGVTYFYAADQFKGLRQDCTVQRLRGRVTAAVYEAHARAALEYGDAAEFNQCQAQLVGLHAGGAADGDTGAEFLAYRILYQAAHARTSAGERLALLRTLEAAAKAAEEPPVKHALAVRAALARGDAPTFFNLYATAPRLGCALMDVAAPGLRFDTLRVLVAALRPGVPVALAARVLGFGPAPAAADATPARTLPGCSSPRYDGACAPAPDAASAAAAATAWLTAHGAIIVGEGDAAAVDCKASADRLAVPEDDAAVAHGDARLAVDDFLKSF